MSPRAVLEVYYPWVISFAYDFSQEIGLCYPESLCLFRLCQVTATLKGQKGQKGIY